MGQSGDFTHHTPANENGAMLIDEIRGLQVAQTAGIAEDYAGSIRSTAMELEVRRVRKLRARRVGIFGKGLFGEPAWDMLLELYAADLSGRRQSIARTCLASGAPPSTALRWLQLLLREGWIQRSPDPQDRPRFLLTLTDKSRIAMKRVFARQDCIGTARSHR